jgi:hypothetical protein
MMMSKRPAMAPMMAVKTQLVLYFVKSVIERGKKVGPRTITPDWFKGRG